MKWVAILLATVGCRITIDEPVSSNQDVPCKELTITVCRDATSHSDFKFVYEKILNRNCVGSSCHQSSSSDKNAGMLPFDNVDMAYASLVGVKSRVRDDADIEIVKKGQPDESYMLFLMHVVPAADFIPLPDGVDPISPPPDDVGFMPRGNGTLCCQKLDAVKRWVEAGAMKDGF